jgi:hypothetical protein
MHDRTDMPPCTACGEDRPTHLRWNIDGTKGFLCAACLRQGATDVARVERRLREIEEIGR